MAFALKAASTATAGSASLAAVGPRRGAAPAAGRVSFRGAAPAGPAVAVRAAAAAVAQDRRSISGKFAELREQGKVRAAPESPPLHDEPFSLCFFKE
jgi:tryptophan synthase alpha chain